MADKISKKTVPEQDLHPVIVSGFTAALKRPVYPPCDPEWSNAALHEFRPLDLLTPPTSKTDALKIPTDFLAPDWNRDYQHPSKHVHGLELWRGGLPYWRPFGWSRVALRVTNKEQRAAEEWLGTPGTGPALRETRITSEPGEWAVSYVGVGAGPREGASEGLVISTPDPKLVKKGADEFVVGDRVYKLALQLRVDPARTKKDDDGDYYVTKGLDAVRPYGVLVLDLGPAEVRNRRRTGGKVSMAIMMQTVLEKMRQEEATS